MRSLFLLPVIFCAMLSPTLAQAQVELAGYEKIYDAPTRVNLGGRPVIADIEFHQKSTNGKTQLALVTDVTKFVVETENDLKNWIANRRNDCGERWKSGEPRISFPDNAIRFAIYLEIEYWSCGWNGKGTPGRMAQETGTVDVTLIPYVENGKLQARLGAFTLSEQTGISKYLPLEFIVRRALEQELDKLNDNPKFYRAPQPLFDENFVYEGITATETEGDRIIITARYAAAPTPGAMDRILARLRTQGITQQNFYAFDTVICCAEGLRINAASRIGVARPPSVPPAQVPGGLPNAFHHTLSTTPLSTKARTSPPMSNTPPNAHHDSAVRLGLICGVFAYGLWGMLPVYLKALGDVSPMEIVGHRILWSVPFGALILTFRKQWGETFKAFSSPRMVLLLGFSAAVIGGNWLVYVWAVANDRVLQASLGYYINPLMFVAAGVFVLKEKLNRLQMAAVAMASLGVAVLTFGAGVFPWVSMILACSFTAYGYVRKMLDVGAMPGLFIETAVLSPFALIFLIWFAGSHGLAFGQGDIKLDILLIAAGPVTVLPLMLFALAARRLRFTTLGFLQYIGPTGQFLLGLYYGEPFTLYHAVCFGLIWSALGVLSIDAVRQTRRARVATA